MLFLLFSSRDPHLFITFTLVHEANDDDEAVMASAHDSTMYDDAKHIPDFCYLFIILFLFFRLFTKITAHFARPTGPARKAANEPVGRPALCITRLFHPGE